MIDVMFHDAGREPTQKPDPKHYRGVPCKRGHSGTRFRVNRNCVECEQGRRAGEYVAEVGDGNTFQGRRCRKGHDDLRYKKGGKCVACAKSSATVQRERNPKRTKQTNAAWRKNNAEVLAKRKADYARKNRDKIRSGNRNAKARKRAAPGRHTGADIIEIRLRQGDRCFYCQTNLNGEGHVDHFIPIVRGGPNWPHNLCLACQDCNLSKGGSDPFVWMVGKEINGIAIAIDDDIHLGTRTLSVSSIYADELCRQGGLDA